MNFVRIASFCLTTILCCISLRADADGWAIGSQHDQLKGYMIADVGEVSKVDPPFNTKWERDVYQMNGRCFVISGFTGNWGYGGKSALLLVNSQKNVVIALIQTSISSVSVDLFPISGIKCPSGTSTAPSVAPSYDEDISERRRQLQRRQEELNRKLEELRRQ